MILLFLLTCILSLILWVAGKVQEHDHFGQCPVHPFLLEGIPVAALAQVDALVGAAGTVVVISVAGLTGSSFFIHVVFLPTIVTNIIA